VIEVGRQEEIADSLRRARAAGADAVNVLTSSILLNAAEVLATAAIDVGLPTICSWREMAEAGCLASYGPPMVETFRTVGMQIARILHGARVAEIPVEQSTHFELTLNLKTARALGLTVSPSLLASADEVIE
jgi:putative tryptophan/tyrosine transport system substrate-binding protein